MRVQLVSGSKKCVGSRTLAAFLQVLTSCVTEGISDVAIEIQDDSNHHSLSLDHELVKKFYLYEKPLQLKKK